MRIRVPVAALVLALPLGLSACESAEAKCTRLKSEASGAFGRYAQVLQAASVAATAARIAAKAKLDGDMHQRHEVEASRHAHDLHGAEKSSAWYRTFLATEQALCSKDPECLDLKLQITESDGQLKDLAPRIELARAAERAAKGDDREAAKRAADAVPPDEERPESATARTANAAAVEACE